MNWYAEVIGALEEISVVAHHSKVRRILVEVAKRHPKLIVELYEQEFGQKPKLSDSGSHNENSEGGQ